MIFARIGLIVFMAFMGVAIGYSIEPAPEIAMVGFFIGGGFGFVITAGKYNLR